MQHITEFRIIGYFFLVYKTFYGKPVRFIDAFVEALSLQTLGFRSFIKGKARALIKSFLKSTNMDIKWLQVTRKIVLLSQY
jgi:hypothetical protein